jgi:hypothetical protein
VALLIECEANFSNHRAGQAAKEQQSAVVELVTATVTLSDTDKKQAHRSQASAAYLVRRAGERTYQIQIRRKLKTRNNQTYKTYDPLVQALLDTYILCSRCTGLIRSQLRSQSFGASFDEESMPQYREKSLPTLNPFIATEFKIDAERLFDEVLESHPDLEPTLAAVLNEAADLPHDKINAKQNALLVDRLGRLAEAWQLNPRTYFAHKRLRAPR